mmetsp:Transcript_24854/g.44715  ORF Transcript_24854/g.44715 Transcript_24854/m.44715 type:complete len:544 (+) Transcript_24854:63-1694(+)
MIKTPDGLSHVGKAAYTVLRSKHARHQKAMWNVTKAKMIGSLQQTPSANAFDKDRSPDFVDADDHSNWFADKMCEIMSRTTVWCDVLSLAAPDGYFKKKFKDALQNISKNAAGKSEPVIVRLMFGNIIGLPINCDKVIRHLTENLPKDSNIQLWVGAWRYGQSWNHTKVIAVDGKYLHTGGHNLWSDVYLKEDPVHDLSLEMEGSVAQDAHKYANEQWKFIEKKQGSRCGQFLENVPDWLPLVTVSRVIVSEYPRGEANEFAPYYTHPNKDHLTSTSNDEDEAAVPVISVGRQGALIDDDRPSDDAFVAMFDASKTIIRMSLQDIGPITMPGKIPLPGTGWPKPYLDALARAIWKRSVDVEIVLSSEEARSGYSNGWSAYDVGAEIIKRIQKQFPEATDAELRQKVEDNLRICYIRHGSGNAYPSGRQIANHTKYFIVDDVCSYTGSQNMYVCDLAEWGVIIDDAEITEKMLGDYWNPLWEASFDASDCEVQDVMDGLEVDRDGEVVNTYSADGKKKMKAAAKALAKAQLPPDTELYDEDDMY